MATQDVQEVISTYVGQLTEGCGDGTCDEVLCATGRCNASDRLQRGYTSRSARIIAISLATGPHPTSHLCPRYRPPPFSRFKQESQRDPSAWSQALSDTAIIQHSCDHTSGKVALTSRSLHPHNEDVRRELKRWHEFWNHTLTHHSAEATTSSGIDAPNDETGSMLYDCLKYLTSIVPKSVLEAEWQITNKYIGRGLASPSVATERSNKSQVDAIRLFDYINYEPAFRVFCQMLKVVSVRGKLVESFMSQLGRPLVSEYDMGTERIMAILLLRKAFVDHWNGEPFESGPDNSLAMTALAVLMRMAKLSPLLASSCFPIEVISERVEPTKMVRSFQDTLHKRQVHHFLKTSAIFTTADKALYFRHCCLLRMRDAHSAAHRVHDSIFRYNSNIARDVASDSRVAYLKEHYLVLSVSRANVLEDAFDQLWHRHKGELLRPLRVRLGEMEEYEVGQDLGGVQIEFFNLVCKELMKEDLGMFTTDTSTGYSYFRAGSLQPLHKFELCGLLFGLALYNGIAIPVSFPQAFYYFLLDEVTGCDTAFISDNWPTMAKSLESVLNEEVNGLEFVFPMEANGLRLSILPKALEGLDKSSEDKCLYVMDATPISRDVGSTLGSVEAESLSWPGWRVIKADSEPTEVVSENRKHFVLSYMDWLIFGSSYPQWQAFKKGFGSGINRDSLRMLSPIDLRDMLEGSNHLDVRELRAATLYDEPYSAFSPYIKMFWDLVASWPESKQKQLVKFVTAAERVPAAGAGNLTFKIQGSMYEDEGTEELPTSSTCFGVLTLPEYPDVETMDKKLTVALEFGLEGFGTG